MNKFCIPLFSVFLFAVVIFSQVHAQSLNANTRYDVTQHYDKAKLNRLKAQTEKREKNRRDQALNKASAKGWPLVEKYDDGSVGFLDSVDADGDPVYLSPHNVDAAISTRTSFIQSGGLSNYSLNGENMTAHIWDVIAVRPSHAEFEDSYGNSRVTVGDGSGITSVPSDPSVFFSHGSNVTGTVIARGYSSGAKGMAPKAKAVVYQSAYDQWEAYEEAMDGMLISNHSYGRSLSSYTKDWTIGAYGEEARGWDGLMHGAPYYLMVASAGNDGQSAENGSPLEGNIDYDKLTFFATAKNNLVVAAANDANISHNGELISANIADFSSVGPTDDLRIKPDITGNGRGVYTPGSLDDTDYSTVDGTSFAAPNVAGSLLLLQQQYHQLFNKYMRASTLKGLALHTADDIESPGPDAKSGWGLLNAKRAADFIASENKDASLIEERYICDNQTSYSFDVTANGLQPLEVSISWTDEAGTAVDGIVNSSTPVLVNDLDLRVIQGSTTYNPYKLSRVDHTVKGDNKVDPFEKVVINNASGDYTIRITHKGINVCQYYSIVVSGIRGDFVAANDLRVFKPYYYGLRWSDLSEDHVSGWIEVQKSTTPTGNDFRTIHTLNDIHATFYSLGTSAPTHNYRLKYTGFNGSRRGLVKYSNITFDAQLNGATDLKTFRPYYYGLRWSDPNADYHRGSIQVQRSYTSTSTSFYTMATLNDIHDTYYPLGQTFPQYKYRLKFTDSIGRTAFSNISDEGVLKSPVNLETFKPYYYNLRWTDPNSDLLWGSIEVQRSYTPTSDYYFVLDTISDLHTQSYFLGSSFPKYKYRLKLTDQLGNVVYSNVSDEGLLKPVTDLEIFQPEYYGLRWSDPNASIISGDIIVQRSTSATGRFANIATLSIHDGYYALGQNVSGYYYRLKLVDSLGRVQYSNVVSY